MQIFIVILAIPLVIFIYVMLSIRREKLIRERISSMGGTVISIERRNFFTGLGPFMIVGKGKSVYRIRYLVNNTEKEGWVRFGGLFGPDWRL